MKNLCLLLAVLATLNLHSQEDDYCICEEVQEDFDFFNNMMSSTDAMISLPKDNNQFIVLESEEPSADLFVPNGTDETRTAMAEKATSKRKGPSGIYPVRSYREAIKRKVRRIAIKKRRQARKRSHKYRGGCPVFR